MFIPGKIYNRRKDIHAKYSGQQQGGICTPANYPMVLIFTGDSGSEFGYKDGWTDDGVFLYTGEGQVGDMKFIKGNKAIRDHIVNGKNLYLFQYVSQGHVKFIGEVICTGYHYRQSLDKNKDLRQAIVFELAPIEEFGGTTEIEDSETNNPDIQDKSLLELRELALQAKNNTKTVLERKKEVKVRSTAVKLYALKRAKGFCEYCGNKAPFEKDNGEPFLEVHHIKRLSDGGPDHPDWVAALCPNCHRKAHYSKNRIQMKNELLEIIPEKKSSIS